MKRPKLLIASVFFTFFIDNLCWSIVFPIFAPYFLNPQNHLFSPSVSESTRTAILGLFLMAFPLGQFMGAPLLGEYADRCGRKKALVRAILFTLVGLVMTSWSVGKDSLVFLFIGRLLTGIFSSNTSICLASLADLSENEQAKAKHFGYFSAAAGLSFIVGAFLGGKLSDLTIHPLFSPSLPIWIGSGLTLVNLCFVALAFQETSPPRPSASLHPFEALAQIKLALRTKRVKQIYIVYFLFLFAWTILFQFIPVISVQRFHFTSSNIGDLALFMGLCWSIGSAGLNPVLVSYFSHFRILEVSLCLFAVLTAAFVFPEPIYGVLGFFGLCVILGGIAWPLCNSIIEGLAPPDMRGKLLGMSLSVQSLAMALAPLVGGLAFKGAPFLPFLIGSLTTFSAVICYFALKK